VYFLCAPAASKNAAAKNPNIRVSKFFISFFCRTEISFVFQTGQQEIAGSD